MNDSSLSLKHVGGLLADPQGQPRNYWIPAYQRGYRWSPAQVTQLLDDIWEFIQNSDAGKFYCLQPLVVKARPDGSFEVVDGQQRLTTIHIILTYLKDMAAMLTPTFFRLTFETRNDAGRPPLDPIELHREMENIDYHHICQAYLAVERWCAPRPQPQRLKLLQHLLNDDASGRNVKVIWFELGANDNEVDAFTRLNVGKIKLTDDELIRALFLGRRREKDAAEDTAENADKDAAQDALKVQIAYEWDFIEKELQAADFWAFLTDQKREHNRIGFLFELMTNSLPAGVSDENYQVFHHFQQKLDHAGVPLEKLWLKIKQEFMRLQEWFEDERRITYHIVGYLVTQSVNLVEIRELSEACTKSQFDRRLRDRVYEKLLGQTRPADAGELQTRLETYLNDLEYPRHRKKIEAVLLLFNIATLLENGRSNLRFQFDAFKDERFGWDLEHIRSRASSKITDRTAWLTDCRLFLATLTDAKAKSLTAAITHYLAPAQVAATDEQFGVLRQGISKFFDEADEKETHNGIGNLTLLDSATNRSYQNAPFAVKRQTILAVDKSGIFVPLCTRNVFLKRYSEHVGSAIYWTEDDADDYQSAILNTLTGFFIGANPAK